MKRKFIVFSNVVITFILGLFGVGCESEEPDTMYAYGTAPSYFRSIKGTVTGVNNTEVEGIEVKLVTIIDDEEKLNGMSITDSLGRYDMDNVVFSHNQDTVKCTFLFKDTDGEKNGSYLDKSKEVTILRSDFDKETGDWSQEINVQLEAKKEDE